MRRSTTSAATPCLISISSNSGTCRPAPAITLPARDLSMQSADARTPDPVYARPSSSNMPCTVPSSPRRPCSALKTHSNPPSRRTSQVSGSRSTSVTSWPRPRNAFATCSPERIETSRSADFPPRRTASLTTSFPPADQLYLGLEIDAEPALDLGHHALDQLSHVAGLRPAFVDDEIA